MSVQTPEQIARDEAWTARSEGRIRGFHEGLRLGYVQGVRWGLLCGACTTACAAFLLFSVASALGWL
jgi:hypothetical protein